MTDTLRRALRRGRGDLARRHEPASRLATGNLAHLIRDKHVVGVTTNPTIFQKAMPRRALRRAAARPRAARRRRRRGGPR